MTAIVTGRRLGELVIETMQEAEMEGAGSPPRTRYRPTGVILQHHGNTQYWITRGETYRLAHDGTGWHVTCPSWSKRHAYRLADPAERHITELAVGDTVLRLDESRVYEIREGRPYGPWQLLEL